MSDDRIRTPTGFRERLEAGDRWIELVDGRLIRLSPPDEVHGNVVRNLSHALSRQFRLKPELYACYELGLVVDLDGPTIRTPAISCFRTNEGLDELDRLMTETVPTLVVEVSSSNDRREAMTERIQAYRNWSIPHIWIFDPISRHVHVFSPRETPRMLKETEVLTNESLLPGFSLLVGDVFLDPRWASTPVPKAD